MKKRKPANNSQRAKFYHPQRRLDPELQEVLLVIQSLSPKEISQNSGNLVGRSTISNWRAGKVRSPLNYTLSAALAAAGYERKIVRRKP